jgi:hypothetical protein
MILPLNLFPSPYNVIVGEFSRQYRREANLRSESSRLVEKHPSVPTEPSLP